MTKYEKITILLSSLALLLALLIPIMSYLYFNPILQEIKYTGKLLVDEKIERIDSNRINYKISIKNSGELPIKDIIVGCALEDSTIKISKDKSDVYLSPIKPFSYINEGNRFFIIPQGILAREEEYRITIKNILFSKYVHTYNFKLDVTGSSGNGVRIWWGRGAGASGQWK